MELYSETTKYSNRMLRGEKISRNQMHAEKFKSFRQYWQKI